MRWGFNVKLTFSAVCHSSSSFLLPLSHDTTEMYFIISMKAWKDKMKETFSFLFICCESSVSFMSNNSENRFWSLSLTLLYLYYAQSASRVNLLWKQITMLPIRMKKKEHKRNKKMRNNFTNFPSLFLLLPTTVRHCARHWIFLWERDEDKGNLALIIFTPPLPTFLMQIILRS